MSEGADWGKLIASLEREERENNMDKSCPNPFHVVVVPDRFVKLEALREYGGGIPLAVPGEGPFKLLPLPDQRCVRMKFLRADGEQPKILLLTVDGARCLAERLLFALNRLEDT